MASTSSTMAGFSNATRCSKRSGLPAVGPSGCFCKRSSTSPSASIITRGRTTRGPRANCERDSRNSKLICRSLRKSIQHVSLRRSGGACEPSRRAGASKNFPRFRGCKPGGASRPRSPGSLRLTAGGKDWQNRSPLSSARRPRSAFLLQQIDCDLRAQIGEQADAPVGAQKDSPLHLESLSRGQLLEIFDSEEVNIGRIIPLVGEKLCFGSAAGQQHREPHGPMAEVGKCHDDPPSNAQHFAQHAKRVMRFLESLA